MAHSEADRRADGVGNLVVPSGVPPESAIRVGVPPCRSRRSERLDWPAPDPCPNFHEIPINSPLAPVHNNQRDGMHRQALNRGRVAYEPNSLAGGCPFQAGAAGFVSFP